jgi:hypothetical protein
MEVGLAAPCRSATIGDSLLVHIDAHPDLAPPLHTEDVLAPPEAAAGYVYSRNRSVPRAHLDIRGNDEFIYSAIRMSQVSLLLWVYPVRALRGV